MLLLLPVLILVTTLLALAFSNLRRPMRSSWLLASVGALLSWLSLLFLRLWLPISISFPGWWVGRDLGFVSSWSLSEASWTLAFALSSLLLAGLLRQVDQAVSAKWLAWAKALTIGAAALVATLSGDVLAFIFSLTVLDLSVFVVHVSRQAQPEDGRALINRLAINLLGTLFLTIAWALSGTGSYTVSLLVVIAAAIRLGLVSPSLAARHIASESQGTAGLLSLIVLVPSASLLLNDQEISPLVLNPSLLLLLLPGLHSAFKHLSADDPDQRHIFWLHGQASLAIAAALIGLPSAALAFALALLFGEALLLLVQTTGRPRSLFILIGGLMLSALPFTPAYATTGLYQSSTSVLLYAFLPIQALLLLGWVRRALQEKRQQAPAEPWMRSIQAIGLYLVPVFYILLGFGLASTLKPADLTLSWWPGATILLLCVLFTLLPRLWKRPINPKVSLALEIVFSLNWLSQLGRYLFKGIEALLNFVSRILEGQAGVLWALLLVALLLSLVAQFGLAG